MTDFANPLGDRFHPVPGLALQHWLGQLSDRRSDQTRVNLALTRIYEHLWAFTFELLMRRREQTETVVTPMEPFVGEEKASVRVPVLADRTEDDPDITVVNILSAGMVPSQVFRDRLLEVYPGNRVHMDHVGAERRTDDAGHVVGTKIATFKSARAIKGGIMLAPDPMGATGSSGKETVQPYFAIEKDQSVWFIGWYFVHAIVTPKYLETIAEIGDPRIHVIAGRVDPGLTEAGYIFPGAGGIGERSNGREMGH